MIGVTANAAAAQFSSPATGLNPQAVRGATRGVLQDLNFTAQKVPCRATLNGPANVPVQMSPPCISAGEHGAHRRHVRNRGGASAQEWVRTQNAEKASQRITGDRAGGVSAGNQDRKSHASTCQTFIARKRTIDATKWLAPKQYSGINTTNP